MASACVNNAAPPQDSAFLDFASSCPRISFSRDFADGASLALMPSGGDPDSVESSETIVHDCDELGLDLPEFEFRLDDPVAMLPADELFSDGKLVPLQAVAGWPPVEIAVVADGKCLSEAERSSVTEEVVGPNTCEKTPKEPKRSSRLRELLGLKKQQNPNGDAFKETVPPYKGLSPSYRSFRHLLRHSRSSSGSEPASIFARRSFSSSSSSSSSGTDHEDLPRFSLDFERPTRVPVSLFQAPPRVRISRPTGATPERQHLSERVRRSPNRRGKEAPSPRGASVDSPRINASGKVVFQGLEQSASSPGICHQHHRGKSCRGLERLQSANVRVSSVLNVVPVGSLLVGSSKPGSVFGLSQLFSANKNNPSGGKRNQKDPDMENLQRRKTNSFEKLC